MTSAVFHPPRCEKAPSVPARRTHDSDRLLVLTLAVVLVQNGAPSELILALLYIAM